MCIIAVTEKRKRLDKGHITRMAESNPDGSGLAWFDSAQNRLFYRKPIWDEDELWAAIQKVNKEDPIIVHCRIATGSALDKVNTHPHLVSDTVLMAHNGILGGSTQSKSDTVEFVDTYLKPLCFDRVPNINMTRLITRTIGSSNKMAFIDATGDIAIANEDGGEWDQGVWYSNTSYKRARFAWSNSPRMYQGMACGCCGTVVSLRRLSWNDKIKDWLCPECKQFEGYVNDELTVECESCGESVPDNTTRQYNGSVLCDECYAEIWQDMPVYPYKQKQPELLPAKK